jgi:hypothetical protein
MFCGPKEDTPTCRFSKEMKYENKGTFQTLNQVDFVRLPQHLNKNSSIPTPVQYDRTRSWLNLIFTKLLRTVSKLEIQSFDTIVR